MKRTALLIFSIAAFSFSAKSQGYDIKINLKGCKDTMAYLVKYIWDQQYIADTCKNVKNGLIEFKGKEPLDRGMYVLVSESKTFYFDFIINENQKFTVNGDIANIASSHKSIGSEENAQFFSYVKFITDKNIEFNKVRESATGKKDSAVIVNAKIKELNDDVRKFETDFMVKVKGSYLHDMLNLKTEKEPKDVPMAKNGRPDSVYQYYYYKNHYFDGIDFKDEKLLRTQYFDDRVKKYFESVIVQHPDTLILEIDKLLAQCEENSLIYNTLLGYFSYKYEQSRVMGFDKVFVHLADAYIIPGKAKKTYNDELIVKVKERVDIMRNLLLDSKVPDLFMIDTTYGKVVRKMGFDTATSSKSITDLYYKNIEKLKPMYKTLYQVNAKYTILVFWAADCGHCKTEIPKLNEELKKVKGKIDFKVYAVQTKDDLFDMWRKFIINEKLGDFINVYDPVHLNNLKERFDIYSTPVLYILDKDKKIMAKRLGAEQVVDFLKAMERISKEEAETGKKQVK